MHLKHMDQLNLLPENNPTRPKMANYVLLSFGSDGGLNQPNGTGGREQIIFNGKLKTPDMGFECHMIVDFSDREEHATTSNNSTLQRLSERPSSAKRTKKDSPKVRDLMANQVVHSGPFSAGMVGSFIPVQSVTKPTRLGKSTTRTRKSARQRKKRIYQTKKCKCTKCITHFSNTNRA